MLTVVDSINTMVCYIAGILFISNYYPFRSNLKIRIPICMGIVVARSIFNVYLVYHYYMLKNISYVLAFVLCTIILLKSDNFKYMMLNALCISIVYISETLAILLMAVSRHQSMYELADSDELRIPLTFLCMLIATILHFILGMIAKSRLSHDNRSITSYEVISFLILIILEIMILYGLSRVFSDEQINTFLVIFSVGFCVLNFGLYFLFVRLASARRIEQENQLMKQQSEMQLKAYERLSEQYNESLRIVHDMKKHIRSLDTLVENNSDIAAEYQQMLYNELNRFYPNFRSDNQILSVIINNAITRAKHHSIDIQLNIEKINLDFISTIDMTTIFSNLLDNAIEACTEVTENKCIKINMIQQMNFITLNIHNPYNKVNIYGDVLRSTKKGHFGIGLENVRKALETYCGTLNIKTNNMIFSVTAIIPIPE
ncbi:MAG: ATP-binding protein [Ruminococcus sp.]|nr:ATP-binding protein [Ruminococcus sp.]